MNFREKNQAKKWFSKKTKSHKVNLEKTEKAKKWIFQKTKSEKVNLKKNKPKKPKSEFWKKKTKSLKVIF